MTPIEIRERVAREVMGLTCKSWPALQRHPATVFEMHPDGMALREVPHYESDIAAAFEVLDAVINKAATTLEVRIDMLFPNSGDTPEVSVTFTPWWEGAPVTGRGHSVQEAICLAALAAVKAKEGK